MLEALVFVMMTGLSDQHGENVLWHNGRPYMIDADNALKLKYMTTDPNTTSMQSGFAAMSGDNTDPVMRGVMSNARPYETQILDALRNPQSDATRQLLQRAEAAFTGQTGRTVPIETAVWGTRLQVFIGCGNDGHAADVPLPGPDQNTRWQYCNKWAQSVTNGGGANAPGSARRGRRRPRHERQLPTARRGRADLCRLQGRADPVLQLPLRRREDPPQRAGDLGRPADR